MRKRYLFLLTLLFPLATMLTSGTANAADPDKSQYDAALKAFPTGAYYIMTEIDGIQYYVTASGSLEERTEFSETSDGLFTINQVDGGAYATTGWHIEGANGHFSNTTLTDNKANLHPGTGVFRLDTGNNRNDWESQVFFLDEESGKIAIRSCNTAFGESSWADAGRAFWTYEVDETGEIVWGDYGPMPCYSYEPAYIWTLEQPAGFEQVKLIIDGIYTKYEDYIWDDRDEPTTLNMGTEFGQYADFETWGKFWDLLQVISEISDKFTDPDYDYYSDADAPSLGDAKLFASQADSLYQAILDSEVPYSLPNGNGYYRIKSILRYYNDVVVGQEEDKWGEMQDVIERQYLDKVLLASYENMGMFGTLREDMANQVWKLTQVGDSILIQNAGMESYISASETPGGANRVYLTEDVNDAACVVFDWAGEDYLEDGDGTAFETFNIRLASKARHAGNYVHQNGHARGKDSGTDLQVSFWNSTYGKGKYADNDGGTSEWYLEPVSEEEVADLIAKFAVLRDHDLLVKQNNELRTKVLEALTLAKDVQRTPMIESVSQLSSPNSDPSEGQHLEYLIDGDGSTFWHTSWHSENQEPQMVYNDISCHYLQIEGMDKMVGDCELYVRERAGADNDRIKKLAILGTDNLKNEDEDWELIADITLTNTDAGQENTVPFTVEGEGYPYVRVLVYDVASANYSFRTFWHAAEIQFYTVRENPNSQFVLMGEVAQALQDTYDANILVEDADITPEIYNALLDAYERFLGGLVDPAELRAALKTYAKATEGVAEGTNPGYWSDMTVTNAYNDLYAEVDAYNTAGKYNVDQIHKYAVMLKAMQKSVMEGANGVKTDKWYRIMYPTEEMFDAYSFNKDGGDNCSDLAPEDQKTMWGTFVSTAKLESEEVQDVDEEGYPKYDEEGNEVMKTNYWLEATGGETLRESDRLFFMNDDAIEYKDASLFRFMEIETDGADYTALLQDVKDNMVMALDLSTTYTLGEPLITKASQFSSNASYPGNDGQKLETGCLIDGDVSTYWHSDYSKTFNVVPYLQVALNEPVSGLIEVYVARRNTNNGHVVRMYVQGSNDAETWTNIGYIETPFVNASTPVYSQPIDLGGTFSHLRFTMTNRSGSDGGSNIEFDPFAEDLTADDYNVKFTYFHASEFQVYPVTPKTELTGTAKTLQDAYVAANKVVLKDATAEDFSAATQAYKAFQSEFNAKEGKTVLPNGLDKAPATYALQNKATGLFVMVSGTGNQNNIYLKTVPTLVGYKAMGYQRSLLSAKNVAGVSCSNLHAGESNRRFCTWGSTEPTSNSGLVICEADINFDIPAEFNYVKDFKPGRIYGLCNSVDVTPEATDGGALYTALGQYTNDDAETFLALKQIETIPAGDPVFYIYGDTTLYDAEDDAVEPVKFTMPVQQPIMEAKKVNGVIGSLVNHSLAAHEIYFTQNFAKCIGATGSYLSGPCVALDIDTCPQVDPEAEYDFSILISEAAADAADGVKDINTAIEKISQPGNVYSMDGKLLRSGATLNSLKAMGKGMYILNGVKVIVK